MNKYMVLSETKRHYGPFPTAHAAAKWANKRMRWNKNWSILRLFKP